MKSRHCQVFEGGNIAKKKKREPKISKAAALRILYTWATFEGGVMLTPANVEDLIKPFLKEKA